MTELKRMTKDALMALVIERLETVKSGERQIADLLAERDRMRGNIEAMQTRHASATAEREAAISRLKGELLAAHVTIARQGGYIDRALEDDSVRELGAAIVQPAPPPMQPEHRRCRPAVMEWEAPHDPRRPSYDRTLDPKSVAGKPWTDL